MTCGPLAFICDAAGGVVSSTASAGFNAIAQSFGEAARTLCTAMWGAIARTTGVGVHAGWMKSDLALTVTIGVVVIAALFALQLIKAVVTRNGAAVGRALVGSAIGAVAATAAVTITDVLLTLTDVLANGVMLSAGAHNVSELGQKVTPVAMLTALTGTTPALVIALSSAVILASLMVWAVFIVRKALIIVAVVFAPVAFAGGTADATRGWVRKWIEFTLTMIFSKLVIVMIFVVATSMVSDSGSGTAGLSDLVTGILLLFLAAFAPSMVLKLVHFIGGDIAAAHHSSVVGGSRVALASANPMSRGSAQKVLGAGRRPSSASAGSKGAADTSASTAAPPPALAVLGTSGAKHAATKPGGTAAAVSEQAAAPQGRSSPRRSSGSHRAGRDEGST